MRHKLCKVIIERRLTMNRIDITANVILEYLAEYNPKLEIAKKAVILKDKKDYIINTYFKDEDEARSFYYKKRMILKAILRTMSIDDIIVAVSSKESINHFFKEPILEKGEKEDGTEARSV